MDAVSSQKIDRQNESIENPLVDQTNTPFRGTQEYNMQDILIERLIPRHDQPRKIFDQKALAELAQSISNHGVIQPLVVTPTELGNYYIIVGERRWRAAKIARLEAVPCIIRNIKDHDRLEMAIIENIQREAMTPIEEANSYKRLIEEYDYTHDIIAKKLGKSRAVISNSLRILDLPQIVIADLESNKMTVAHARALCGIDEKSKMLVVHAQIIKHKLSVRETEALIRRTSTKTRKKKASKAIAAATSPDFLHIAELLKDKYGTSVKINGDNQNGSIEFSYYSHDDLTRFLDIALKNDLDKS